MPPLRRLTTHLPLVQPHTSVFRTAERGSNLASEVVALVQADLVAYMPMISIVKQHYLLSTRSPQAGYHRSRLILCHSFLYSPCLRRAIAAERPPMPAPMTATSMLVVDMLVMVFVCFRKWEARAFLEASSFLTFLRSLAVHAPRSQQGVAQRQAPPRVSRKWRRRRLICRRHCDA